MCEATKQMKTILVGEEKTPTTKAILIFAETVDRSLSGIEKNQINYQKDNNKRFDEIIEILKSNKADTEKRHEESKKRHDENAENLNKAIAQRKLECGEHKAEIKKELAEVKKDTEDLAYFKRHPKLLKWIGGAVLIVIIYALGDSDFLGTIFKSLFK